MPILSATSLSAKRIYETERLGFTTFFFNLLVHLTCCITVNNIIRTVHKFQRRWGGRIGGGHRFLVNAYGGGGHSLFRQSTGGGHEFFRQSESEKSDLIPDTDIFFIIAVNSFMVQYKKQCLETGGVCYFSHPDGGVMQFYHLGMGGVNFFFLLRGAVCHPPPLKFMNSP